MIDAGVGEVEAAALDDFVRDEHHVAQHGEQVLLDAADHLAIDERRGRRIVDLELDAPRVAHDLDCRSRGSGRRSPWRCRCRAPLLSTASAHLRNSGYRPPWLGVEQLADLRLREVLEAAARADAGVDEFGNDDAAFHARKPRLECD